MNRNLITCFFFAVSLYAHARVGIGTLTPKAGLHVADSSDVFCVSGDVVGIKPVPVAGEGRRMIRYVSFPGLTPGLRHENRQYFRTSWID